MTQAVQPVFREMTGELKSMIPITAEITGSALLMPQQTELHSISWQMPKPIHSLSAMKTVAIIRESVSAPQPLSQPFTLKAETLLLSGWNRPIQMGGRLRPGILSAMKPTFLYGILLIHPGFRLK